MGLVDRDTQVYCPRHLYIHTIHTYIMANVGWRQAGGIRRLTQHLGKPVKLYSVTQGDSRNWQEDWQETGRKYGGHRNGGQQGRRGGGWGRRTALGLGLVGGAGLGLMSPLLADEELIRGKSQLDRVREFSMADTVFEHFAEYQTISDSGKKTTLMSCRDFYNAMSPGCVLSDARVGRTIGIYKKIQPEEINSEEFKNMNKLPLKNSILNSINDCGLLTYTDFHFLLLILATPTRYLDIIFHGFDVSADQYVVAKEFVYVMARIANVKTNPEEQMKDPSGLLKYLFSDDLSRTLTKQDFVKLQQDLIEDMLSMEFLRYVNDTSQKMSETDFCRHLLYSSSLTQKKKDKMIKLVADKFKDKSEGITFDNFKTFYKVLFGGADLERAMFFLDLQKEGVTKEEFCRVAKWVVGADIDHHVLEVVYCLLDEDGDLNLSTTEFHPVLFSWRHARGFQKGALSIALGNMKF